MKGVFSSVNSNLLDILGEHMHTNARDFHGLAESTKAGGSKMRQYLKQNESKLIDKESVRQNQVPYMVEWVHQFLSLGQP